jgi:aminoglycoside phosphotransferase
VTDRSWEQVLTGRSGAVVRRSPDGRAYAKSGSGRVRAELADEHERLAWLAEVDLPSAEVLECHAVAVWLDVDVAWVEEAIAHRGLPVLGRRSDGAPLLSRAEVQAWLRRPSVHDDES